MGFGWLAIFLAIFAVVVALGLYGWYKAEQRKKELAAWAAQIGLRFTAEKTYGLDAQYDEFACLKQGSGRYGFNHLYGPLSERTIHAFDYHYETYSNDSKGNRTTHHHYFSAVVIEVDLPIKPLAIRPENFFDKVTAFFGIDDIDFESEEFSRTFHVKSPDRRWAFDVLHQETMEFLLHAPRYSLEFGNRRAIAFRESTFSIPEFESAIAVVAGILDRLPEFLVRELKESS